ncbi:Uncharacterised protein [Pantoea agglomerans]|uniref:Uncharacterized protein n=1 Tax=Enterobacter agglomerans TaxID=549 RepID=A0A379AKQ4_ENTAG|nr:Uncharacterised protein [Pantoea agglomerans]
MKKPVPLTSRLRLACTPSFGLLYAKTGDTNKAFGQFATEKQLFPESAPYMDFLMSKKQGVVR